MAWYENSTLATIHVARYGASFWGGNFGIPQRVEKEIAAAKEHGWTTTAVQAKRQMTIWSWIPVILLFPFGLLLLLLPIYRPKHYTVRFERDAESDLASAVQAAGFETPPVLLEIRSSTAEDLRTLKSLLDESLITHEEYERKRQALVERL